MNLDHIDSLARARALFANVSTVHSSDPRPGEVRYLPIRHRPAPPDEKLDNQTRLAGIIHDHSRTRLPAPQREAISRRLQAEYGGEQAPRVARAVTTPRPKRKSTSKGLRRVGIIRREKSECNHMHEGKPAWFRGGSVRGTQRYECACCGSTGYAVPDGSILAIVPGTRKRVPSTPENEARRAACPHPRWRKDGKGAGGCQREQCAGCGQTRKAVV